MNEKLISQIIAAIIFGLLWFMIDSLIGHNAGVIIGISTIYSYLLVNSKSP